VKLSFLGNGMDWQTAWPLYISNIALCSKTWIIKVSRKGNQHAVELGHFEEFLAVEERD
jgi:hypothetical protein